MNSPTVTVDHDEPNDVGYFDAQVVYGSSTHPSVACLAFNFPNGLSVSDNPKAPEWLCDGVVHYDLVGGMHYNQRVPTPRQRTPLVEAAHEEITFYCEISFSETVQLLPPPPHGRQRQDVARALRPLERGALAAVSQRLSCGPSQPTTRVS